MKEQYMITINKTGKTCATVAKVMKIVLSVFLGILACTLIILLAMPRDFMEMTVTTDINMKFDLGFIMQSLSEEERLEFIKAFRDGVQAEVDGVDMGGTSIELIGDYAHINGAGVMTMRGMDVIIAGIVSGIIYLTLSVTTLIFIEKLCRAFRDSDSPFSDSVIKEMRKVGFALLPWAIVPSIAESIINLVMMNGSSIGMNIDLTVIAGVLLVFGLVKIFTYGAELEKNQIQPETSEPTDTNGPTDPTV